MKKCKDYLYEQVARIGKAVSSPKRLELLELLCQAEKPVETLAGQADISVKLASAHLRELRQAHLVSTRREGKYVFYRLADSSVADFWVCLRSQAEARLVELQVAAASFAHNEKGREDLDRASILEKARAGEVLVLDVRPAEEFVAAHLPYARSMPLAELAKRLADLPLDMPVVAYCRGPFCLFAKDAVELLRSKGYRAFHLTDGVAEWRARGLPIEV